MTSAWTARASAAVLGAALAVACGSSMTTSSGTPAVHEAPYGAWASPLSAARATAGALRLGQIALDGDDIYWLEGRASEGGRNVLVRASPAPRRWMSRRRLQRPLARPRVRRRGLRGPPGRALRLELRRSAPLRPHPGPAAARAHPEGYFYAQCRVDAARPRLVCIREDHTKGDAQPPAALVAVPLDSGEAVGRVSCWSGRRLLFRRRLSPDGATLAWLQWRHPEHAVGRHRALGRPTSTPTAGRVRASAVAGGDDESIFQPEWSPDGALYFVSDRTGWWNLYRRRAGHASRRCIRWTAEFGKPQWAFGMVDLRLRATTRSS